MDTIKLANLLTSFILVGLLLIVMSTQLGFISPLELPDLPTATQAPAEVVTLEPGDEPTPVKLIPTLAPPSQTASEAISLAVTPSQTTASPDLSTAAPTQTVPTAAQPTLPQPIAETPIQTTATASAVNFSLPPGYNPLTGSPVEDASRLERRPVLVKVSNYPRYGRPHAGLSYADIVFEYYIGEGANRFLALYYGQDAPKIGPIRSGRLIDAQLVNLYQGILSYGNADPEAVEPTLTEELGKRAIPVRFSPCPPVCGVDTHSVAGVFADSAGLSQLATQRGVDNNRPTLEGLAFSDEPPPSNRYAIRIGVEYNSRDRGEWHYDANSQRYLRWIEDADEKNEIFMQPLTDRLTGKQLAFANVILIFAKYNEFAPTLHEIEVWNNFEGQRAIIFRDGLAIDGIWRVISRDRPIQFFDNQGAPVALKPGNSWVIVAGLNSSLDEISPGQWEMHFRLP